MADEGDKKPGGRPDYKVYRSRPKLRDRVKKPDLAGLRADRDKKRASEGGKGGMRTYKSRGGIGGIADRFRSRERGGGERRAWWKYALIAAGVWVAISVVAFGISAQIQKSKLPDTGGTLTGGDNMITGKANILVLGGDQRGEDFSGDKSANDQAPPRADTIMLLRAGGGAFRKLSIPRDTLAEVPGFGEQKINSAFALGDPGPDGNVELMTETVEGFLDIDVNHVIVVDFDGFADFIDTVGGIEVDLDKRLCGVISGGRKNGGQSIRLGKGEQTLNGDQALLFSRIRQNTCNPGENDIDRARRQQQVLAGIKGRLTSPLRLPYNFIKGPWIGWRAPKAIISDLGMVTMPELAFAAIIGGGGDETAVLEPSGSSSAGNLIISDEERREKVDQFLNG